MHKLEQITVIELKAKFKYMYVVLHTYIVGMRQLISPTGTSRVT